MANIGRNSPCLCGSGKKYKKCCLAKDGIDQHRWSSLDLAIGWLLQNHGDEMSHELVEQYWGSLGSALIANFEQLPKKAQDSFQGNSDEWLVAQGRASGGKLDRMPVTELLLAPGGPEFDPVQKQWLQRLGQHPLGIYEIQALTPAGMSVRDLAAGDRAAGDPAAGDRAAGDPAASGQRPIQVTGPALPPEARDAAVVGMRLLPDGENWTRTVAWYPFEAAMRPEIELAISRVHAEYENPDDRRWLLGAVITDLWWDAQAHVHLSPEEREMAKKREFQPITDIYDIVDGDRLASSLASADLVEGSREFGWTHFEKPESEDESDQPTWIHALNPSPDDQLAVFSISEFQADEGRQWLDGLTGDALVFKRREIENDEKDDPTDHLHEGWSKATADEKTARMQAILESDFAGWASTPIPHLNGKTPTLAMGSEQGQRLVIELLRHYEESELEEARDEERQPASFQFLWDSVGALRPNP